MFLFYKYKTIKLINVDLLLLFILRLLLVACLVFPLPLEISVHSLDTPVLPRSPQPAREVVVRVCMHVRE